MPRLKAIPHTWAGKAAAICVKIMTDMPLPTPRSVMSSPSHMTMPVPAVMVSTMVMIGKRFVSYTIGSEQPWNNCPVIAIVT